MAEGIILYSTPTLDFATTLCFLLFQEIKLPPMEKQYPKVDLLSKEDPAQSTYENQTTSVWLLEPYNKPFSVDPLLYFHILMNAFQ